jgi:hypothetical protein
LNTQSASPFKPVGAGVLAIDTEFVRPRMDASHLIVADGRGAGRLAEARLNAAGLDAWLTRTAP